MVVKVVQFAVLAAAVLLDSTIDAATSTSVKLCGRQLSEIMSKVCHAYNSPAWDVPTVVEQPSAAVRRKRQVGIADECCIIGCTWDQLSEYCSISAFSESPLEDMEAHIIADRSAEQKIADARNASPQSGAAPAGPVKSAVHRAAPVVGTVSPLITWGRTLNTDLAASRNYAYVVYT